MSRNQPPRWIFLGDVRINVNEVASYWEDYDECEDYRYNPHKGHCEDVFYDDYFFG